MSMLKKYLMEDIYLQKSDNKIIDKLRLKQYNNGISKNWKNIIERQLQIKMIKKYLKKCLKKDMSPEARQKIINNLRSIMIV